MVELGPFRPLIGIQNAVLNLDHAGWRLQIMIAQLGMQQHIFQQIGQPIL